MGDSDIEEQIDNIKLKAAERLFGVQEFGRVI